MRSLFVLGLSVCLFSAHAVSNRQYYVTVPSEGRLTIKKLVELGLDVGGINLEDKTVTVVVTEEGMRSLSGFKVLRKKEILAPDTNYHNPDEVIAFVNKLATDYPHLVKTGILGKTEEGRDIPVVHITNHFIQPGKPKKAILFDGMHHAREVMTVEITTDIMDYLTKNYLTDPKVKKWVDNYDIWVVPMMNPDGNNKVWNSSSMWRKNNKEGYGVDINRNYTHAWNSCNGSSGSKYSDTYRGPSAGSEPETQAIMNLVKKIKPKFNISYHSYSEIVIYPFGCDPKQIPAPDAAIYWKYATDLAKLLKRDSGNGSYTPGTSYELLYNVDGGSIDWMYADEKVMSFVIEVNSDSQGFQPSYDKWRNSTVERQRAGWQFLLDNMDGPGIKPE